MANPIMIGVTRAIDPGNIILVVKGLQIMEPCKQESELTNIPGVVSVAIFANRPVDVMLLGTATVEWKH